MQLEVGHAKGRVHAKRAVYAGRAGFRRDWHNGRGPYGFAKVPPRLEGFP
jgi:hypothetical protein